LPKSRLTKPEQFTNRSLDALAALHSQRAYIARLGMLLHLHDAAFSAMGAAGEGVITQIRPSRVASN
jgi:hypothetical protein